MTRLVFLFKVDTAFTIPGRQGIFLSPGLPVTDPQMPPVRVGTGIQIRTPDGIIFDTNIEAIEHAKTVAGSQYPIQLPAQIRKEQVPPGTEIWLL